MNSKLSEHAVRFAPEYGEFAFSDHYPMAVTALRALSADVETIDAFGSAYLKRLEPIKKTNQRIDAAHMSVRLGDSGVYPQALTYFNNAIASDGPVAVLRARLPELTTSITAAAFHGVIRTAYGLLANERLEIAAGLAYWWAQAKPIRFGSSIGAASSDVQGTIDEIAQTVHAEKKSLNKNLPTISARLAAVADHPRLGALISRAANANISFDDIASVALRMYVACPDLTTLHCMTGAHAARLVCEHVVMNDERLRQSLWAGVCAAYAASGAPELQALTAPPADAPAWPVIAAAACRSLDEHDIKFAFTCLDESRKYGRDAHYRRAVSQRLGVM